MRLIDKIQQNVQKFATDQHGTQIDAVEIQPTKKDHDGDLTVVVFPLLRFIKSKPADLADALGTYLENQIEEIKAYHVIQGFLNLIIDDVYYLRFLSDIQHPENFGIQPVTADSKKILVEYSSPNTNKPLHLGHIRNNLLGASVSQLLSYAGYKVHKTQIINDRGIHICKSMVAWKAMGNGETPESTGEKGDALVGRYYVAFDTTYKKQLSELIDSGIHEEEAKNQVPIQLEAQEMLRAWEAGDETVRALWTKMNAWVYDGFAETYQELGVSFDSYYYESDTYLLGKDIIDQGLSSGVFFKKDDGSVWCDLSEEGLDEKLVLRADGTSVYITQDLGTALLRYKDHPDMNGMVYTVGNEQDYHFKVLFLILNKLGYDWASQLHHLSYGMVDLPSGKMKSREGTVVDADGLMQEMRDTAQNIASSLGKLDGLDEQEKNERYHQIGIGALKYYILKVDPAKRILFNPKESVDFNGNTGPFIQYAYARIQSIVKQSNDSKKNISLEIPLDQKEKELLKWLELYPQTIQNAAEQHSPALVANYVYELVKRFNSYYQKVVILSDNEYIRQFRVRMASQVGYVIQSGMGILGIECPKQM
jgi:arginyl-tRNA synthetase|tara:strand:+ start:7370 stop:9145 length:1776 start_codon:yes stop_codon:yes gene_type:complete